MGFAFRILAFSLDDAKQEVCAMPWHGGPWPFFHELVVVFSGKEKMPPDVISNVEGAYVMVFRGNRRYNPRM